MRIAFRIILLFIFLQISNSVCYGMGMEVDSNVVVSNFPPALIANLQYQPWAKGYLDVTKPPYNCLGDGVTDDSNALQQAITDAYNCNLVVFFPGNKTYLITKQLQCIQYKTSRKFGFQLIGSTKGTKPVIKLKDASSVSANVFITFQYIDPITFITDPSRQYGATFRGIDINMGNNPTVSGISMDGAQHCVIEDVKIYGTQFNAGVWKLPGSGGSVVNLTVTGGNIGILQDAYRPNPTITGLTLSNQSQYGISISSARGPVIVTGFKITSPAAPSSNYNAIYLNNSSSNPTNNVANHGYANLCLTDGTIEVMGTMGLAINNYAQDVTMNNVYVKSTLIIKSGSVSNPIMTIPGNANQWKQITSYAFTSKLDSSSVYVNKLNLNNQTANYQLYDPLVTVAQLPGTDFTIKHSWTNTLSWEDSNIVDIVTDYGATPENVNDTDNDGTAIQNAINAVTTVGNANYGKTVFIPRGHFHISGPLTLKSGLKMIGAGKFISVIQVKAQWNNSLGAMLQSVDDATGSLVLSDFAVVGYEHMRFMDIKTANTLVRNVVTELIAIGGTKITALNPPTAPYISFSGSISGNVYNMCTDHMITWWEKEPTIGVRYSGYQMLAVQNTIKSLNFYQLSIEHLKNSPQVLFSNAKNVSVFGFKYEAAHELLNIINSDSIKLTGGSGNYQLDRTDDRAIIVIQNSKNILIQNQNRQSLAGTDITKFWIKSESDSISGDFSVLLYKDTLTLLTKLEEHLSNSTLKILMNLATNEFFLSGVFKNEKITIYNSIGQSVWSVSNSSDESVIKLKTNNLCSGVYVVKINNEAVKFIKGN